MILPSLYKFAKQFEVPDSTEKKDKSVLRRSGKLLGAAVKLFVGISCLQAGWAADSIKEITELVHGLETVAQGVKKLGLLKLGKVLQNCIRGKKGKFFKKSFKVTKALKKSVHFLKTELDNFQKYELADEND